MATQAEQASLQRAIEKALAKEAAAQGKTPVQNLWVAASAPYGKMFDSRNKEAFDEAVANLHKRYPHLDIVVLEVEGA